MFVVSLEAQNEAFLTVKLAPCVYGHTFYDKQYKY